MSLLIVGGHVRLVNMIFFVLVHGAYFPVYHVHHPITRDGPYIPTCILLTSTLSFPKGSSIFSFYEHAD